MVLVLFLSLNQSPMIISPSIGLEQERIGIPMNSPCLSIIMPFEPKMWSNIELERRLNLVLARARKQLENQFPGEVAELMSNKLLKLVRSLNYSTYKKSIAIFVCPHSEKIFYLDIPVEEKILVDDSFDIRELVLSKRDDRDFLLLLINASRSRIFRGNQNEFMRISSSVPESATVYENDISSRVGNFSDPSDRKEIMLDKFLHHIDQGLDIVLNAYRLPLLVMGPERALGHFRKITRHHEKIIDYIKLQVEESDEQKIREVIAPHILDWNKIKQNDLLRQLDAAKGVGKMASGIRDVWKMASNRKGRLLLVESGYRCDSWKIKEPVKTNEGDNSAGRSFLIKDAVDDTIEKILEYGGDVEFVDKGLLKAYSSIALIQYY